MLDKMLQPKGLTLGTSVGISGAAVSPNMGYHSSPAVTALLTLFNVRLGSWLGNPKRSTWKEAGPRDGPLYLIREALSRADAEDDYIYLSDGGHFENLGVYELIRRRCRFIVCLDAGADPAYAFDDLAGLIHKVRVDFGIRITIDAASLRPHGPDRFSARHIAVGTIHYGDVDNPGISAQDVPESHGLDVHEHPTCEGMFIYIKPAITGDEPQDVLTYKAGCRDFPHESTLDQFYSESQFEAYRALGFHSVDHAFRETIEQMRPGDDTLVRDVLTVQRKQEFFKAIFDLWFPQPRQPHRHTEPPTGPS